MIGDVPHTATFWLLGGAEITEAVRQNAREMRALAAEKKRLNRQTP